MIVSFGDYDFTQSHIQLQEYDDSSFREAATSSVALPGIVGVFDPYGDAQTPDGEGKVIQRLVLVAESAVGMTALWDGLTAMRWRGLQRLTIRTDSGAERWCMAKCIGIQAPRDQRRPTAIHLPVTLTFYVPYPRWMGEGSEATAEWEVSEWDTAEWEDSGTLITTTDDLTITNNGSDYAFPRVLVAADSAVSSLVVQRLDDLGNVLEQVSYTGALVAYDLLDINTRTQTVMLNGDDAYDTDFDNITADWLRLNPGSNTIRVTLNSGATAYVSLLFYEEYT